MPTRRGDSGSAEWQTVCRLSDLELERGVTALVHGQALAIFRLADAQVHALGNHDPFTHTSSLARGIVGSRDGVPFVGSPTHGHRFDLRSGECLDDAHVSVPVYDVQVVEGQVQVGRRKGLRRRPA